MKEPGKKMEIMWGTENSPQKLYSQKHRRICCIHEIKTGCYKKNEQSENKSIENGAKINLSVDTLKVEEIQEVEQKGRNRK